MDDNSTLIKGQYYEGLNSGYFNTKIGFLAFSVAENSIRLKLFSAVSDKAMDAFLKSLTREDAKALLGYFLSTLHENPDLVEDIRHYQEVCITLREAMDSSQQDDVLRRLRLLQYETMRTVQNRVEIAETTESIHADAFIAAVVERAAGLTDPS